MVQLTHMYIRKMITLTIQTFVGKVMSLLFNTLSSFVIALLREVYFNFMAAVTFCSDFGAKENKVSHCSIISLSICHKVMGLDALISIS